MDERLSSAAQSGNKLELYALINENREVLRRIDEMEFVDTPLLHIAAAQGHSDFAMEVMNLKPSFARKLNQEGYIPIHVALLHQHPELVLDFVSIDKDLARVKGREGLTPLHHLADTATDENSHLLSQILDYCPDSILDLTFRKQTALHIAASNNQFQPFQTIVQWIQRNFEGDPIGKGKILNLQDREGNTVLHIAASRNQSQMIRLLTQCKEVDRTKTNLRGSTAVDVLRGLRDRVDISESLNFLNTPPPPPRSRESFYRKLEREVEEMNVETINALLVVFTLVLSMTYQALLSPPGGVSQGGSDEGKSVIKPLTFILFYTPNYVAYVTASCIIILLLGVVSRKMTFLFYLEVLVLAFCYGIALRIIVPSTTALVATLAAGSIIVFLIYFIFSFSLKK